MSVRIEPNGVANAIARRPFGYVITGGVDGEPHLRAVVLRVVNDTMRARVGRQTALNVERTGTATLVWPPLAAGECVDRFDDHTVIADCTATCTEDGDSFEFSATPSAAVWHRPAR